MIPQIHCDQLERETGAAGEAVYLLDVRQPWENEYCQLAESTLIPLPELA